MSARRAGPDQLRGLLLTLVIFGHTYAAGISKDVGKWFIYGFHMPIFFAISGWLWRWDSLRDRTVPDLLRYFWKRMLWQWLLVSVLFNLWQGSMPHHPAAVLRVLVLQPSYHLWFIPALVIMVLITQVVLRIGCGWWTLSTIALVGLVLFELPVGRSHIPVSLHNVDHRYGAYFVWFLLGFAIRNGIKRVPPVWVSLPVAAVGAVIYVMAYPGQPWMRDIGFILLNTGLIFTLPAALAAFDRPLPVIGDAMVTIGQGSLWVYLLHPFLTQSLHDHVPVSGDSDLRGRLLGVLTTAFVVAVSTVGLHLTASRSARRRAGTAPPLPPEPPGQITEEPVAERPAVRPAEQAAGQAAGQAADPEAESLELRGPLEVHEPAQAPGSLTHP